MQAVSALLSVENLQSIEQPDHCIGVFAQCQLVAVGHLKNNVLMGICIHPQYRGNNLTATLVTELLKEANSRGITKTYLFTKTHLAEQFTSLGYELIAAREGGAALLEFGWPDYATWASRTKSQLNGGCTFTKNTGAIVLNANPFTKGHLYLIENAAALCDQLLVFVVEADSSIVPFSTRFKLVKEGTVHLPNCQVLAGGPYMVSQASFPAYFTGALEHARTHAELDATIFSTRIAPDFGITSRFVGTEPICPVTSSYNSALKKILPKNRIDVVEFDRISDGTENRPISASKLRSLLADGNLEAACLIAADTTADWIRSSDSEAVIEKLKSYNARH
nr:GNAT family N-acetyltransferase [Pseudovibrio flavus]